MRLDRVFPLPSRQSGDGILALSRESPRPAPAAADSCGRLRDSAARLHLLAEFPGDGPSPAAPPNWNGSRLAG